MAWDREVDVLVVGSGAAGMTAAIAAADAGQRTLIVESTPFLGRDDSESASRCMLPAAT